jgi:hypothetical protein
MRRSLEVLEAEHPQAYRALCAQMAGREVLLRIDNEPVSLAFSGGAARLLLEPQQPAVILDTSQRALLLVIDGDLTLEKAVYDGTIQIRGRVPDLSAFYDGLRLYVQGGVRCPAFPFLLERYRRLPASPEAATSSPG